MKFANKTHQDTFREEIAMQYHPSKEKIAAIYLLTSNQQLWASCFNYVDNDHIDFESIHVHRVSLSAYSLLKAAKSISENSVDLTLSELIDTDCISEPVFQLISEAMKIVRYGFKKGEA